MQTEDVESIVSALAKNEIYDISMNVLDSSIRLR